MKTAGIPIWVTIFALIVFVFGCGVALMAFLGQGMDPSLSTAMSISWGGRQLGLGLAAGIAVLLKTPSAYIAAFVGGVGRDLGDLTAELSKMEPNQGVVLGIVAFLVPGLLGIWFANKARTASQ